MMLIVNSDYILHQTLYSNFAFLASQEANRKQKMDAVGKSKHNVQNMLYVAIMQQFLCYVIEVVIYLSACANL